MPDECPEIVGSCMTRCCESAGRPTFDADCNPTCPSGTSLIDRCAPAPECACMSGEDAGPLTCWGGPCCDDLLRVPGCAAECPAGYSASPTECTPDPAALCAEPWLACDEPSDCVLAPAGSCCARCDSLALEDVIAIDGAQSSAYYASVCPEGLSCPPCVPAENPSLQTTCDAGRCEAFDVRRLELSACTSDAECRLRVPDCCECGADTSASRLIAIHVDEGGAYVSLVCGPSDAACPPCGAVYPDTVEAYCAADGHCDVRAVP